MLRKFSGDLTTRDPNHAGCSVLLSMSAFADYQCIQMVRLQTKVDDRLSGEIVISTYGMSY
ncbi:hypothetical protein IV01_03160 [Pseudomonas syringae]|uniref:Uncharacterized protein n=1 Tax=Pseudomonas syringae TaxID=317 RepID=A0A085VQ55_PSESX|nr:hypothetical protein IV01_03160 [Pseudomonas syringae]